MSSINTSTTPSSPSLSSSSSHLNGTGAGGTPLNGKNNNNKFTSGEATDDLKATQQQIGKLETELKHARDALSVLKADRKRLKAEKFDVLNQMKQLYATLEDKEKELRDFIRTYEKRMRESEAALRQLVDERDEAEREKWTILRHAHDEAERCLDLTNQLGVRDVEIGRLREEVNQLRSQLSRQAAEQAYLPALRRPSPAMAASESHYSVAQRQSLSSTGSTIVTSDVYDEPLYSRIDQASLSGDGRASSTHLEGSVLVEQIMADVDALSLTSVSTIPNSMMTPVPMEDQKPEEATNPKATYATVSKSCHHLSRSSSTFSSKTLGKLGFGRSNGHQRSASSGNASGIGSGNAWGSISRVFSRNVKQQRKTLDLSLYEGNSGRDGRRSWSPRGSLCTTPLTEETATDRFRYWDEAQSLSVDHWKAGHVLAWLEFGLGMGHYISTWAGNIKSGKVLLELTDAELEVGLGLSHAMHRKKLRLAIEERRPYNTVRYPLLSGLGNIWVTSEWLADIGLTQYVDSFATCLMDARMLDNLTKRELEKHLGVTKKAHQSSVVHGITFLRMMKYDRKVIAERRKQCEFSNCDPLVWTNQRLVMWARSIDLVEYADNLKDSGVHGAVMVLDLSFNADLMANAMGIPTSKNIIRRHLATEMESLVQVARARYEHRTRQSKMERKRAEKLAGGSLGRSFARSFTGGLSSSGGDPERGDGSSTGPFDTGTLSRAKMRASLSRAFGRRVKQELMAAEAQSSTSANHLPAPTASEHPVHDQPAGRQHSAMEGAEWSVHLKSAGSTSAEKHRRIKSSKDIEAISITRV